MTWVKWRVGSGCLPDSTGTAVPLAGYAPGVADTADRPLRADARRNRERILVAAREVVGRDGADAAMEAVAAAAGLGVGTLYRHFPTKDALLGAIVTAHFERTAAHVRAAHDDPDAWEAFAGVLRRSAEDLSADAGTRDALMGGPDVWPHVGPARDELGREMDRLIARAHAAGVLREDFTGADMPTVMCGLCATMRAHPGPRVDWRRHLELLLAGLRAER